MKLMAKSDIDKQIRERIDAFLGDISELVRAAALESVGKALGGEVPVGTRRGPGRPRKAAASKAGTIRKATSRKLGKRVRRSAEDLAEAQAKILAFLKANPGSRMEELSKGIGMATKDIRRPLQMLQAEKKVSIKGQKRAATYSVGGGGKAVPAKKAVRKKSAKKKATRKRAKRR